MKSVAILSGIVFCVVCLIHIVTLSPLPNKRLVGLVYTVLSFLYSNEISDERLPHLFVAQ